jgi:hypothetical protein
MGDSKSAGVVVLIFPSIFMPLIVLVLFGLKVLVLRLTNLGKIPYRSILYTAIVETLVPELVLFVSMPYSFRSSTYVAI